MASTGLGMQAPTPGAGVMDDISASGRDGRMAGQASGEGWRSRFDDAARRIDARVGHWPAWLKFLVFAPLLVALTAVLIGCLFVVHATVAAVQAHLPHR
jgi:hypothetical protein